MPNSQRKGRRVLSKARRNDPVLAFTQKFLKRSGQYARMHPEFAAVMKRGLDRLGGDFWRQYKKREYHYNIWRSFLKHARKQKMKEDEDGPPPAAGT